MSESQGKLVLKIEIYHPEGEHAHSAACCEMMCRLHEGLAEQVGRAAVRWRDAYGSALVSEHATEHQARFEPDCERCQQQWF